MTMKNIALFAGFFFISLATFTQGLLPALQPESTQTKVTKVVRTDLGELKWTIGEATDYSDEQLKGRNVYVREGCWYCHSQFVRPVTGESRRWGPISQSGEYAFDQPHMFSTRRIGPDLTRVGLKYSNEWHLAHFWNPRVLAPDSIMPRFSQLFEGPLAAQITTDDDGNQTIVPQENLNTLFDFESTEQVLITPGADGLAFVPEKGKYPVIHTPNDEYTGTEVMLVSSSEDLDALIAYVQKLGTNRGNGEICLNHSGWACQLSRFRSRKSG
jgi:cytochrome c oxidase cbb3-type subunit I/II